MYKLVVLFIVFSTHVVASDFRINSGIYIMPKCFFKITEADELIHIQFAHQDQHLLPVADTSNIDFHPDNVLGTNVFFDKKDDSVVFGPDKCGQGKLSKSRSNVDDRKWVISCGGLFSPISANLTIVTDRNNNLKKFKFKEKLNPNASGRFTWPWKKRKLFHFSCKGLKKES